MTLTPSDRAALRALAEKAIDAPWSVKPKDPSMVLDGNGFWVADCGEDHASARFIAAARTAIPALLDALDASEKERAAMAEQSRGYSFDCDVITEERDAALARAERVVVTLNEFVERSVKLAKERDDAEAFAKQETADAVRLKHERDHLAAQLSTAIAALERCRAERDEAVEENADYEQRYWSEKRWRQEAANIERATAEAIAAWFEAECGHILPGVPDRIRAHAWKPAKQGAAK